MITNKKKTDSSAKAVGPARRFIVLLMGVGIVLASLLLPVGGGLTRSGLISLSILLLAVLFWSTETVNATITALIVLVLLSTLGVLDYSATFAGLGQHTIWRLVGIMIITIGLSKSGLDRRLAIQVLKLARGNVYAMLFLMVVSAQILVFIVPSPQGRTSLLATTYLGILQGLGIRPSSNIGKIVFLGIPIFTILTSASLITGASVEIYAVGLFSTLLNYHFTYVSWMLVNLPVTFLACFLILLGLIRLFPPEITHIQGANTLVEKELTQLGPLSQSEKKMMVLFGILIAMWLSGLSDYWPAEVMVATVLFLPGINILTWPEVQKEVSWGTVILYGSSLSLALALQKNKVVQWVADGFLSHVGILSPPVAIILVFILATLVRLGMTNMTGVVATLFPLVITVAASMGLNPVWLGMVCVIGSSIGFFFPSQNVSSLITYSFGYYSIREMAWAGVWTFLITIVTLVAFALFYWPWVGLAIWPS